MVIYTTAFHFINSTTNVAEKIKKIDQIISALMDTAVKAAVDENVTEYSLDDGQTKIQSTYRGAEAIFRSIQAFEKIRSMYVAQINRMNNGSIYRLVDSKNLNRNNYGNGF